MDGTTLKRLRLAFVGLGVLLLLPLALLVRSAASRLEEQRRLKHEVVAERIFDEMERELASLLARERARPSGAYGATQTRAETWAPFVIGYFTHDVGGPQVTAREQLTAERAALVAAAAREAWAHPDGAMPKPASAGRSASPAALVEPRPAGEPAEPEPAAASAPSEMPAAAEAARASSASSKGGGGKTNAPPGIDDLLDGALTGEKAQAKSRKPVEAKQEEVLRQLNRSGAKKKAPARAKEQAPNADQQDPLSGMDEL